MSDNTEVEETIAHVIGFLIAVGSMILVFFLALYLHEWAIAVVAVIFAALMWSLSHKQIKEYFHGTTDTPDQVHQTREHQDW